MELTHAALRRFQTCASLSWCVSQSSGWSLCPSSKLNAEAGRIRPLSGQVTLQPAEVLPVPRKSIRGCGRCLEASNRFKQTFWDAGARSPPATFPPFRPTRNYIVDTSRCCDCRRAVVISCPSRPEVSGAEAPTCLPLFQDVILNGATFEDVRVEERSGLGQLVPVADTRPPFARSDAE